MRTYDLLNQRDPRWSGQMLGTSTNSIGGFGCALLSCTIAARYFGHDILPDELNKELEPYYVAGDQMNWYGITKLFPDISFVEKVDSFDDAKAKQYLNDPSYFVICLASAAPIGAPKGTHFFPLLGDGMIEDPWDGTVKPLSTYTDLLGLRVYKGTPNQVHVTPTPTTYKGLDLTNLDSVKVAIDTWSDVASGLYLKADDVKQNYVKKTDVDQLVNDGISQQLTLANGYKKQFDDLWTLLLSRTPSDQVALHDDAKLTAYLEYCTTLNDKVLTLGKEKEQIELDTNKKIGELQTQVTQLQTDLGVLQTRANTLAEQLAQVNQTTERVGRVVQVINTIFAFIRKKQTQQQLSELNELQKEPDATNHPVS